MNNDYSFFYNKLVEHNIIKDTNKNNYNIPCKFHNETKGQSLSINFTKGCYNCFSPQCQGKTKGNLKKLLIELKIINNNEVNDDYINNFELKINNNIINESINLSLPESFDLSFDNRYKYAKNNYDYLLKRGIEERVLIDNKVKYNDYFKRVIIPVFQEGICYGYVTRTTLNNSEIDDLINKVVQDFEVDYDYAKQMIAQGEYDEDYENIKRFKPLHRYSNNFGFKKELVIFESLSNDYINNRTLVLCEGQINAMKVNTFGDNSIAIIGSYPTFIQVMYIKNLVEKYDLQIIPFFDNDKAGRNNIIKLSELIGDFIPYPDWNLVIEGKNDICDLSKDEYILLKNNLIYF